MKAIIIGMLLFLAACTAPVIEGESVKNNDNTQAPSEIAHATFAGGCFWCIEAALQDLPGVLDVISGYTGGTEPNPSYKEVSKGTTNHLEAVRVTYDPTKISYGGLLDAFWRQIDPTDTEGQFADKGSQYKTAIFYHDEEQRVLAEESKRMLAESGMFDKPIVTDILPVSQFYEAEEAHQDYFLKRTAQYQSYKKGSGRAGYIEDTWADVPPILPDEQSMFVKPSDAELKAMLSPLQYKVTQQDGTERAFDNEYWDNTAEGIYVDLVSGEPLYSSTHKYVSGTGWPSFTQPLVAENIVEREDNTLFSKRTEVRSKQGDNHLGHVFNDGPQPTGQRYCMNSAALKFIPKENLEEEGYGEFLVLFENA